MLACLLIEGIARQASRQRRAALGQNSKVSKSTKPRAASPRTGPRAISAATGTVVQQEPVVLSGTVVERQPAAAIVRSSSPPAVSSSPGRCPS